MVSSLTSVGRKPPMASRAAFDHAAQAFEQVHHVGGAERLAFQSIRTIVIKVGGGDIEGDGGVAAGVQAEPLEGGHDEAQGLLVA